jgi:hypothetical protein
MQYIHKQGRKNLMPLQCVAADSGSFCLDRALHLPNVTPRIAEIALQAFR